MIESINTTCISENLQRIPRSVSFESEKIDCMSPSNIFNDKRSEIWYQQEELVQFKDDVMNLCRELRCDQDQPLMDTKIDIILQAKNCCARGLENFISLERQRNRFLARKAIVEAQRRYPQDPEKLAMMASKCAAWAKEVALCTGYQDFYQVYKPEMSHLVPQTMSTKFPVQTRKRRRNSNESESSSVRKETPFTKRRNTL